MAAHKTIFITGGASGIGRAVALALAARGFMIALLARARTSARSKQDLQQVRAAVLAAGISVAASCAGAAAP